MTEKEKKGVDISDLTKEETEVKKPVDTPETSEMSEKELLGILQEQDPILAMVSAQIFDTGRVVGELVNRVGALEKYVDYLLSKDKDILARVEEIAAEAEVNNVGQPETTEGHSEK